MAGEPWRNGEEAAKAFHHDLDTGTGVVDLREAMEREGIAFVAHDFGVQGGDGRYVKKGGRALIIINTHVQSTGRARYTIAHEIGHHRMHGQGTQNILFVDEQTGGGGTKPPEEKEADAFAAYFLAPKKSLKASVEQLGVINVESVIDLMIRHGLSYQTTVYRLHNSELINAAQRDSLIDDAQGKIESLLKQKGGYTEDDRILQGAELPRTLRENALKLFAHGAINDERLAEMLRMTREEALTLAGEHGVSAPELPDIDEEDLSDLFDDESDEREA